MTLSTPALRFSVSLAIKTASNPRIQGAMPLGLCDCQRFLLFARW
jgi:hypothetical protein